MQNPDIINQYVQLATPLVEASSLIEGHIRDVLADFTKEIHSIGHRLKNKHSLREKLARPDRVYEQITDITDIIGFRVITYFEEDVHEVGKKIEEAFKVDYLNSTDRRNGDTFGYRSLHYICPIPEELSVASLDIPNFPFEIQVRTILQHAWAEIEHDLGYKSPVGIPVNIKRKFARIAGLLEIADEQFGEIRTDLSTYEHGIAKKDLDGSSLDLITLKCFLDSEPVQKMDSKVAKFLRSKVQEDLFFPDYLLSIYSFLGVRTVSKMQELVRENSEKIDSFLVPYFSFTKRNFGFNGTELGALRKGYSLLILGFYLLKSQGGLEIERVKTVCRFFSSVDNVKEEAKALELAREFATL